MKLQYTLTKENFWSALNKQYPEGVAVFCAWVDEYKQTVGWSELFNPCGIRVKIDGKWKDGGPKFHDLPGGMQLGIWLEFIRERSPFGLLVYPTHRDFDFAAQIRTYVAEILQPWAMQNSVG